MRWCAAVVGGLLPAFAAVAEPPRVLSVVPDHGDSEVEPGPGRITITFDQEMSPRGYSVCGGGESFPKLSGRPRWEDPRTLVLTVTLQPSHEYRFSVNCPSAGKCRNLRGESAIPYPVTFRTAAGPGLGRTSVVKPQVNVRSIEELRQAVAQRYSYRDLRGVDWDAAFAAGGARLQSARTAAAFARAAAEVLSAARDVHIWLQVGDAVFATHRREVQPNIDLRRLPAEIPNWRENACVATGRFEDGIGYVLIKSWSTECADGLQLAYDTVRGSSEVRGLIIDVRPNSGGDEQLAREFAGCFISAPRVYARHASCDPQRPGGFTALQERVVTPSPGRPRYRSQVLLLIGPAVMSTAESFVLMMSSVLGCRTLGEPTYGSSGNPQPVTLANGVMVYLPSWRDLDPDGKPREGVGIAPAVTVPWSSSDRGDPVLAKALHLLRD